MEPQQPMENPELPQTNGSYGQPQMPNPSQQNNPLMPNGQTQVQSNIPRTPDQGRSHLSQVGKKYFSLIEFDDQEELLLEIRKHPFGLFIILVTGFFISLALFAVTITLAASSFLDTLGFAGANAILAFIGFILSVLILLVTAINAQLYRNNVVYVTNEKLAQMLFITLFNRKISQLSIGDVQDVTVSQNGFLPNLIGYGTLVVETAGEQQNYTFTFVPNPYETSKVIINAHENSIHSYGN